jgi:hypothetical protein
MISVHEVSYTRVMHRDHGRVPGHGLAAAAAGCPGQRLRLAWRLGLGLELASGSARLRGSREQAARLGQLPRSSHRHSATSTAKDL